MLTSLCCCVMSHTHTHTHTHTRTHTYTHDGVGRIMRIISVSPLICGPEKETEKILIGIISYRAGGGPAGTACHCIRTIIYDLIKHGWLLWRKRNWSPQWPFTQSSERIGSGNVSFIIIYLEKSNLYPAFTPKHWLATCGTNQFPISKRPLDCLISWIDLKESLWKKFARPFFPVGLCMSSPVGRPRYATPSRVYSSTISTSGSIDRRVPAPGIGAWPSVLLVPFPSAGGGGAKALALMLLLPPPPHCVTLTPESPCTGCSTQYQN